MNFNKIFFNKILIVNQLTKYICKTNTKLKALYSNFINETHVHSELQI